VGGTKGHVVTLPQTEVLSIEENTELLWRNKRKIKASTTAHGLARSIGSRRICRKGEYIRQRKRKEVESKTFRSPSKEKAKMT